MILTNQTICAPATPPGTGAISVVRVSGKNAFAITDKVFRKKNSGKKISELLSHSVHFGNIPDGDELIDEVLVSVFKSPHSYTGEDVVEISCHGSAFIVQKILNLLIRNGARAAEPGEFTMRAFINGKMDLSQAEGVADIIASDSEASLRLAMQQMRGGYSAELKKLRDELIRFASLLELELDFSEEDVEFADRSMLLESVQNLKFKVQSLMKSFELGNVLKKGIPVVIAGKPNAGKSTLLNALLREDRAIVSHIPGTTRDTVEEEITLDGILFRFIDTAGLRQTMDAVESIGVSRTLEKVKQCKTLIYLFDVNETTAVELQNEIADIEKILGNSKPNLILCGNKTDLVKNGMENKFQSIENIYFISAKNQTHIDLVITELTAPFVSGIKNAGNATVTNARHYEALLRADESLSKVIGGLASKTTNDFIATDLRHAMNYLGTITGEITTDDLLKSIFEKFCIGK